jgi:hypothetical protein
MDDLCALEQRQKSEVRRGLQDEGLAQRISAQKQLIFNKLETLRCFKQAQKAERVMLGSQIGSYAGSDCTLRDAQRINHNDLYAVCRNLANLGNAIKDLAETDKNGKPQVEKILKPLRCAYDRYDSASNNDERARAKLCIELILGNRNRVNFADQSFMNLVRENVPYLRAHVAQSGEDIAQLSDEEFLERYLSRIPQILLTANASLGEKLKKQCPELHMYLTDYRDRLQAVHKEYDDSGRAVYRADPELLQLKEEFNCIFGMSIFELLRINHLVDDEYCRDIIDELCVTHSEFIQYNAVLPTEQFHCFNFSVQRDGINCGPWVLATALAVLLPPAPEELRLLNNLRNARNDDRYTEIFSNLLRVKFGDVAQGLDNVPEKIRILMLCDQFKDVLRAQGFDIEHVVQQCITRALPGVRKKAALKRNESDEGFDEIESDRVLEEIESYRTESDGGVDEVGSDEGFYEIELDREPKKIKSYKAKSIDSNAIKSALWDAFLVMVYLILSPLILVCYITLMIYTHGRDYIARSAQDEVRDISSGAVVEQSRMESISQEKEKAKGHHKCRVDAELAKKNDETIVR